MSQDTIFVKKRIFKSLPAVIASTVILIAVIAAIILHSVPVRCRHADEMLARGKYREALEIYESIGDYESAEEKIRETKYLLAIELMTKDERKEARALLEQLGSYRDAEALLEQLKRYDQAWAYMVTEHYEKAAEEFQTMADFLDAAEKAEECRRLGAVKDTYDDGLRQFQTGKWLDAYRTLSTIRGEEYEDTLEILEEIAAAAPDRVRYYAERGERGKMLAFLRLTEETDNEAGEALRQELVAAETIEEDWSYFQFDPACLSACSPHTPAEDYASTLLYMILHGETELTLLSNSKLNKADSLQQFYRGQNMLNDIIPGYAQIYKIRVTAQNRSMQIHLQYQDKYSEQRIKQIIETYETFCVESLHELVDAGLLSASMSHRQKATLISEWVGFYLSYDRTKEIYLAGIALEEAKGVCSAYASLYHRMCNLAGIPTYGQTGVAYNPGGYGAHIWLVHVDEAGDIFYADPTWADPWDIDFSVEEEKPTVALFADHYLERCLEEGVVEYRYPTDAESDQRYFWSRALWTSHDASRTAAEIIATHRNFQG